MDKFVCDISLAKQLYAVGVLRESLFYWVKNKGDTNFHLSKWLDQDHFNSDLTNYLGVGISSFGNIEIEKAVEYYSAFTVGELGGMLPDVINLRNKDGSILKIGDKIMRDNRFEFSRIDSYKVNKFYNCTCSSLIMFGFPVFSDNKEANVKAKMLIYLMTYKLI